MVRSKGVVKWFNDDKGYGFIKDDDGQELFVHFRQIKGQSAGRKTLKEGQRVEFAVVEAEKGLQAEEVEITH